jgi:hypothetical protein
VVDTHYNRYVFVLARRCDEDLFAPAWICPFALAASVKSPVASITISTPSCFQGKAWTLFHREALDLVPVYDQKIVLAVLRIRRLGTAHFAFERSLGGVILQQVGQVICGDEIVDGDNYRSLCLKVPGRRWRERRGGQCDQSH